MVPFKTPAWISWLFPGLTWRRPEKPGAVYLTFDDGPVPEATEKVLFYLHEFNLKATFFCVGENLIKYPGLHNALVQNGHTIGNHTYNHLDGWKTTTEAYLENVAKCQQAINDPGKAKPLMRPPYGRLTPLQLAKLKNQYEVVMWEVLSGDFSPKVSAECCLEKSCRHTREGSIVLFHDSLKTSEKLDWVLPRYLEFCLKQGFDFYPL